MAVSLSSIFVIFFVKGDTHTVRFTVYDETLTPLNFTGATGTLLVYDQSGSTVATISGTPDATPTDGMMIYKFGPSDTSGLAAGNYTYRAKVTMGDGSVYTIREDSLVLQS